MEIMDRVYEAAWAHHEATRDQVGIELGMANANRRYAKRTSTSHTLGAVVCGGSRADLNGWFTGYGALRRGLLCGGGTVITVTDGRCGASGQYCRMPDTNAVCIAKAASRDIQETPPPGKVLPKVPGGVMQRAQ